MKSVSLFFIVLFAFATTVFSVLFTKDFEKSATVAVSLILPIITLIYLFFLKKEHVFFTLFLVLGALSNIDLLTLLTSPFGFDLRGVLSLYHNYFVINGLLILAYISLMIRIISKSNFKLVWGKFKFHIIVLALLGCYMVTVFVDSVIVADMVMYGFDIIYNISLVVLFSMVLINYFYYQDKKALFLFIGVMLFVFEEVLGIFYAYVSREWLNGFIWIVLYSASFYFMILQSQMETKKQQNLFDSKAME